MSTPRGTGPSYGRCVLLISSNPLYMGSEGTQEGKVMRRPNVDTHSRAAAREPTGVSISFFFLFLFFLLLFVLSLYCCLSPSAFLSFSFSFYLSLSFCLQASLHIGGILPKRGRPARSQLDPMFD